MGRGGKKKGKQQVEKEDEGSPSLAVGESSTPQPSTSQTATAKINETGGKEPPKVESETKEEDASEGLGLGDGGKKRQRKKKECESSTQATSSQVPVETGEKVEADTKVLEKEPPKVEYVAEQKVEEQFDGLGLGGGKKRQRKKKPPAAAAPTGAAVPAGALAPAGVAAQAGASASAGAAAPTVATPASVADAPGIIPTQPLRREDPPLPGISRGWNVTRSAPVQQPGPSAFPQQPPTVVHPQTAPTGFVQPVGGAGRGRGRPSAYDQKITVVGTSAPAPRQTNVPSRHRIPEKILGGRVSAYKTRVITNYLEMRIQPMKVYRYDVTIKPDRPKKLIPKAFAAAKAIKFPRHVIAFDQRQNCYSSVQLFQSSAEERFTIFVEILDDNNAMMAFEVSLKFTGVVDLGTILNHMKNQGSSLNTPMEAIQCIDVILQQGTLESYVKVGRQFFKQPRNPIDLGFGLEMWTGLFQSAIFTSQAFINIDVAHKGFPRSQNLVDALTKDFRLNPKQPLDRQRGLDAFEHFIKGLRVRANIGGASVKRREFICNGLVDPPNRMNFSLTDASGKPIREITVAKYFETEKKCRLYYPDLNCMWVGPRDKKIYYPMELLEISYGQALNKQLNDKQLSTMVREAATPPSDRLKKITEVIQNMNYSQNPCFKHFKMEIDNKFFQVDAKILTAPKIDIGGGRPVDPRRGVWQANRFLRASALESWGFIVVEADSNACNCETMIQMIMRIGNQMGMSVNNPSFTKFNVTQMELRNVLLTAQERNLNFMFIIVSGRDKDAYHKIKRKAELEVGILTQCVKEMTASRRMNDQTVRNILLKVNSKLMGINQALDSSSLPPCLRSGGVMVVGADVTHPSPDQMNIPSIAAVTASIDAKCFMYNIEMSVQTPKHEIIVDFENMMFDHLKVYRKHQNSLPRKIFVFRDGVSEGQFAQVMDNELVAVHRAYARHDPVNKPEILFLLVQKRHHTRFFTTDRTPQNVEPGTVVDTHIVHPKELDFYLVSHQAIKGTARPTRYHAVCNDGNIPSDEVEQLTYYLCHLYSRCPRSVSYPTPTYYAHLACFRAKSLTFGDRFDNSDLEKQPQRLRVLDRMLQCSRMFFV